MTSPKIKKTNGTCSLCNNSFSKTKMKVHLESCKQKQAAPSDKQAPTKKASLILAEGSFLHEYWMYFEVPESGHKVVETLLRCAYRHIYI